ncbi:hypothetical protein LAZ67_14001142 [Cordylochernes scorpioides]|uniref:Uncharacterized protein n=1 Tax=Cordylochernes scorpioides TaxID=51811 RepID=A0ABY6L610_9ARAC|nr:hypothetical protein LAZ67_14001142 [Cordylochernes scorpioides]
MLENGIIEQSFSPFSSPVTLVTKRDKTKRFCIDYRKVNELISSDVHPLPRIEDILDRLAQAKYFSTADISSAYWQVPIHPDSRPLLAFATFEGLYQPTRLPFGLKTSPQIYERAISQVLQRHGLDCVAHYFDDFIIYSNTLEEHQNHLRQFFAFCEAEKLQLNFAKCEFFKQSINFLGYTITAGTITPLTRNTDIIHAIKQPHNRKTLQSFLGAVNVYNKFIPEYARLRAPLNNLLKKDVVWNWNEVCQEAFIDLKGNLTLHPILHLYKEGLPCQVYCDASTLGIAGILKQVHPDGNIYPVQYFSRTLRPHEKNYSISELECLAIVESVEKFRIYLMGRKFTIFSDHHALHWLKTIKNPSGRLFRWSLRLSSYEYEVRYIKGKLQYEADLLSRNPFCGFLDATLIKTHQPPPSKESSLTIDRNGLHTVSRKVGPTYGELSQPPESKEPFDLLSLDTIAGFAKYGNTKIYLHVVVDHFSRYAWAFPSKSTSTTTYQQVLKRVSQDGSPKRLLTDRAPAFTSPKFRSFLLNRNIHPLLTTSNNPQANGLCERLNATLTGKLRLLHLENPKVAWTKLVKKMILGKNAQNVQKITDSIKENPRTTLLELKQDTGISKTTIGRIVTKDLKLKKTPAKFIPRFLTNEQNLCRLATCENMLEMTRTDPEWKDKIITGDETWVYDCDPETKRQYAEWRGQDIAPNDFFLFPKLKAVLKGRHFDTRDDIIEKSLLALKSIPKEL